MIRSALRALMLIALFSGAAAALARADSLPDSVASDWSSVPEYRIVPGDLLTLDFGPRQDLSGDVIKELWVRPDGRISVFPIGDVIAAGRTPRELEEALVKLLASDIRSPRVTVEVTKLAGNKIHVLGQVQTPGSIDAQPFMTVVQAIAAAGGFREGAARNSVLIFRRNGSSTVKVALVRVDNELKSGGLAGDLPLSRFDIVYVPRGPIGNLESFTRLFFGSVHELASTGITGWEMFNIDRVFINPSPTVH